MDKHFKISVLKTEFSTNFDKGTVTCKVYYKIKTSDNKIRNVMNSIGKFVDGAIYIGGVYTTEATAKVHPDDEYNLRHGEQVSRAKAESMAYNVVNRYFKRVSEWYTHNIKFIMLNFNDKSNSVIEHNDKYIESF